MEFKQAVKTFLFIAKRYKLPKYITHYIFEILENDWKIEYRGRPCHPRDKLVPKGTSLSPGDIHVPKGTSPQKKVCP